MTCALMLLLKVSSTDPDMFHSLMHLSSVATVSPALEVTELNKAIDDGNQEKMSILLNAFSSVGLDLSSCIIRAAAKGRFDMIIELARTGNKDALYEAFHQIINVANNADYLALLLKPKRNPSSDLIAQMNFIKAVSDGNIRMINMQSLVHL